MVSIGEIKQSQVRSPFALALALAFLEVGCVGMPFKAGQAARLECGMGESEVTTIIGRPPIRKDKQEDGSETWIWALYRETPVPHASVRFKNAKVIELPPKFSTGSDERERELKLACFLASNPQLVLPGHFKRAILKGQIELGMAPYHVVLSRGEPLQKNISEGVYGKHEQWVYGRSTYLYFTDGALTSWQMSR